MPSQFGGVPVNEPIEQSLNLPVSQFGGVPIEQSLKENENLSFSKFGGVPVNQTKYNEEAQKLTEENIVTNPDWIKSSKSVYELNEGPDAPGLDSDKEYADYGLNYMGWFNYNLPKMGLEAKQLTDASDEQKKEFVNLMDMYDKKETSRAGFKRALKGFASDPSTYLGLSTLGVGTVGSQAVKAATKQGIKQSLKAGFKQGSKIGGAETGIYAGGADYLTQKALINADVQEEYDPSRGLKATATGVALGAALGGPIGSGTAYLASKFLRNKTPRPTPTPPPRPAPIKQSSVIDTTTTVAQAKREAQPKTFTGYDKDPIVPQRPAKVATAGNINLNKLETTEDIKNIIFDISKKNDDFVDARRGVVKFGSDGEELAALAKESGLDEAQLLKRKKGEAFNAETAYAARVLQLNSAKGVSDFANRAKGKDASAQDLINLQEAITRHAAIQEQVSGITAEAGRALRSFREMARSEGAVKEKLINEYITQKGGTDSLKDMAEAISKLDSPEQIARFSRQAYKATTQDKIQEAWINALLSSPSTHAVNVLSNALVAASRIPEYGIATALGAARKGSDKVTPTEFGARVLGNVYGTLDGLRAFGKAIVDPESVSDPLTKIELQRQNSISGIKGDIVRLPGRFLTAEDALFKGIGYRQELWGQAIRQAKKEGKGVKRAFEILENPEKNFPDIHLASQDIARYQTFTNPLGEGGQKFQDIIKRYPKSRYIVPFFRTPVNIVKYAGQRTPFGVFSRSYKEAIKKGGAEADLARARVIFGSSTMASIAYLASEGLVTGRGPSDNRERNILRETGWQPYSIKIDDTYYGYNRFEPAGILFGLAADSVDIYNYANEGFIEGNEGELNELAGMMAASVTQNLTNKTFLAGISSAVNAISDPDRYGEDWITRFATSFVPTAVYYARKSDDPLVRDAQGMMDNFYNRIPGLSEKLPARRNVFGETIKYTGTYSPEFLGEFGKTFSPLSASKVTNDTVFNELARLKITPSMPKREIGGVKLTSKQYQDMLSEMIPLQVKSQLEFMINSPDWKTLLDSQKEEIIRNVIIKNQGAARNFTRIKNPQIMSDEILNLMEQLK